MKERKGFRELLVWQRAKALAVAIYNRTRDGQFRRDLSLTDQMRRAAVSVCSNIAAGDERDTNREAIRFLYIAKGSLAELSSQLEIAHDIGYLNSEENHSLQEECRRLGKMLGALIKARSKSLTKPQTPNP